MGVYSVKAGKSWKKALVLLVIVVLMAACSNPYFEIGKGRLQISLAHGTGVAGSRSIIPVIQPIDSYTVSFTGPAAIDPIDRQSPAISCILPVGTWDVRVQGSAPSGLVVAEGMAEDVAITAAGTTTAYITLRAVGTGFGSVSLRLSWPALYSTVNAVEAYLDEELIAPARLAFNAAERTVSYNDFLPAGEYRIMFRLIRPGETTSIYEALHVFGNLFSEATILLAAADFTDPPIAPSGLTVTVGTDRLNLSWTDNSIIVETYSVQRSQDDSTWSTIVSGLPHNVTDYADTSAVIGNTYYYRVIAHNAVGASTPSASASALLSAPGELTITITLANPMDEPITFSQSSDIIVPRSNSLVLGVVQTFATYEWVLDGVTAGTGPVLTQPCSSLSLGVHHLALFVTKNGLLYSKQFRFIVGN